MKPSLLDPENPLAQKAELPSPPRLDRILVPVDFSKASINAVEAATALLKGNESGRLTLIHVVQPMPAFAMVDIGLPPAFDVDEFVKSATVELNRIAKCYGDEVKVTAKIVVGSPAHEIVQIGATGEFDLIVMSSHGRGGFARLMMGSVAETVLNNSRSSVLVIKVPRDESGQPVSRFRPRRFRKVLVGFDGRAGAVSAASFAERIIERTGGRITLIHALPPSAVADYGLQCDKAIERLQEAGVSKESLSRTCAFRAKCGDPWEVVSQAASDLGADLVVVGPHEHLHRNFEFLGSTAQRLVRLSPCSVLAVK